jgi:hypothetical protein
MREQWKEARLLEVKVTASQRENLAPTAFRLKGKEDKLIGYHFLKQKFLSSLSSPSPHISLEDDGCGAGELSSPKSKMGPR